MAEQAERFEDMATAMRRVVVLGVELSADERGLLAHAYKMLVAQRRSSWRVVSHLQLRENDPAKRVKAHEYRLEIEQELNALCNEVLELIDVHLIPHAGSAESKVFYLKLRGDYLRYLAEFTAFAKKGTIVQDAQRSYQQALDEASSHLPTTHPIRLGLALNFSVFFYEILGSPEQARQLSKNAFEDAIADLETLGEEFYKQSTSIMQLLRDNLTMWTSDQPVEDIDDEKDQ